MNADLLSFKSHFRLLDEIKSFTLQELNDFRNGMLDFDVNDYDPRKGQQRQLPDGRKVRTIFTHGHEETAAMLLTSSEESSSTSSEKNAASPTRKMTNGSNDVNVSVDHDLAFVGFFGRRRQQEEMPPFVPDMVWSMDGYLSEELLKYPGILVYSSAEIEHEGDWFNFVLLKNEDDVHHWTKSSVHRFTVRYVI